MNNHSRLSTWFLATVLLGLLTQAAVARDADAGKHEGNPTSNLSAAPNNSHESGGDAASESAAKSVDDIDTRISVQPRRMSTKPGNAAGAKIKLSLPGVKNPHRRVFSAAVASRAVRNAVSVPVSQHELLQLHASEHPFAATTSRIPAGGIGVVGNSGIGKPDAASVRQTSLPPLSAGRGVGLPIVNRGINGTSMSHRGVSPSGLGGSAKTAAGINGTTIRPAH